MYRRPDPLPANFQGKWQDVEDSNPLIVDGFGVIYRGMAVAHNSFTIEEVDGALTVTLGVDDPARKDSFAGENITGLVIDPDGNFHAYNTRFGASFERAEA